MFGKGFPACLLGRLGSGAFLFIATSAVFSSLAVADKVVPAQKTDWIYFDLNWTPQEASPCLSTDIAMANAVIARGNHCEATFSNWAAPWADGEGLTPWTLLCVAPGIPPEKEHWQHMESRGFQYKYKNTCPGGTEHMGASGVWGHFYYYCADSENYDLFRPTAATVACYLKPDRIDPDKQPRPDNCCNVGNPINVALGQKYQREADYLGMPLRFERHYWNRAWRTTYSRDVLFIEGTAETHVRVRRDDGQAFTFRPSGANYVTDPDVESKLERVLDAGVPIGWRYTDEEHTVELYDAEGRLTSITTRSGLAQTLAYDMDGRLANVTDSFGKQLTFAYDGAGRLATLTDPAGSIFQYGYAPNGDLATVTAPDLSVRSYLYNEAAHTGGADLPHALTGITDENNDRFATFKYDSSGRAVQTEHAGGADRTIVAYNADGTRTITDALGTARTMTTVLKQGVAKPSAVTGSGCGSCGVAASYTYDGNGNRTHEYDWKGIWTYRAFSSDGRDLETLRDEARSTALQRRTSTFWHATYRIPTRIDEPGKRTTFTHDANGNVLTKTVLATATSESRTWTYTYNSVGRVLTADGPRTDVSDVTTYTYYSCTTGDECGQVHTITNALSHVTTYNTYNAQGLPLTITDPNGDVTTLTYDARQRLTSRTVGTEQTTFTYWPTGLLKKATRPDGSFLESTYDAAHRLIGIEDSEGNRIVYALDAMGNRTAENVYDPSSVLTQTRTRVFNTLNQLWKEIAAAGTAAVTTTFSYDANSNQTGIDEPLLRNTVQAYDELNRLKQVTDPLSGITKYGYDALDQLISVTDPRNKVTSYTYNTLGDLKQQVSPDTGTTNNTYDSGGNLLSSTDARAKAATYAYDALNRVTSVTYPDQTISYAYDNGTNQKGRLTQVTDASGSTSWSYDTHGRVLSRQQSMGVTKTLGYAYDSYGRLQTQTLPSGNTIGYGYTDGRVTSLTLNGSTTILSNILYQPFGPTRGWTWGNSTLAIREYDIDGKVTDIDSAGLKTFSYDDAFRVTSITDAANSSLSESYSYDLLDRLTSATGTSLNQGWTYDANGNRLTQTGSAASTYTVSSTSNRLSGVAGSLSRTYSFDNAGNTTSDGTATFVYNDAGRMVSATQASVTTTYALNALGQRVKKTASGSSTYFVYDEAGHLVGEYDNSGNLIQETVWLADTPVATLRPNGGGVNHFYVHTDHLNTPRRISRPSDNVIIWRWDSDPFGTTAANQDPDGDSNLFAFNLRFPGQYYDPETGLHYNYFRDYDPQVGRYAQSDPIGLQGGLNTYAYVLNNPVKYVDANGLEITCGGNFCGGTNWPAYVPPQTKVPMKKKSWGIGGGLIFVCIDHKSSDGAEAPEMNMPFPPEMGGGVSICAEPEKPPVCEAPGFDVNFGLGRRLGISFGSDQSVCLNLGFGIGAPMSVTKKDSRLWGPEGRYK